MIDGKRTAILTLDFITPVVDDPFTYGQIAAANALSDVYAMGGRPLVALNIVGFPVTCEPLEVLSEILKGGQERGRGRPRRRPQRRRWGAQVRPSGLR